MQEVRRWIPLVVTGLFTKMVADHVASSFSLENISLFHFWDTLTLNKVSNSNGVSCSKFVLDHEFQWPHVVNLAHWTIRHHNPSFSHLIQYLTPTLFSVWNIRFSSFSKPCIGCTFSQKIPHFPLLPWSQPFESGMTKYIFQTYIKRKILEIGGSNLQKKSFQMDGKVKVRRATKWKARLSTKQSP